MTYGLTFKATSSIRFYLLPGIFTRLSYLRKQFAIHGPLCTALDFLGDHYLPENLKPGDWLEFRKVGAYGFTESMPYFLCHDLPLEALIKGGDLILARRPGTAISWMV